MNWWVLVGAGNGGHALAGSADREIEPDREVDACWRPD
jgi:hypothetical protein